MIKKILLFTVILPIITVFFSVLFLSKTYAEGNNLFIYQEEVFELAREKKEILSNSSTYFYQYKNNHSKRKSSDKRSYFTQLAEERLESIKNKKEITESSTVETILAYEEKTPKRFKAINVISSNKYISDLGKNKITNNIFKDIKENFLSFEINNENALSGGRFLANIYIERTSKKILDEDDRYENLISSIPISSSDDTFAQKQEVYDEEKIVESKEDSKDIQEKSGSKDITLSITILPVRFVYIDDNNNIVRIWNNVKRDDTLYGLKFYKDNTNTEISPSKNLKSEYFEIIKNIDVFAEGIIYEKGFNSIDRDYANNIEITVNYGTEEIEEIYTLI